MNMTQEQCNKALYVKGELTAAVKAAVKSIVKCSFTVVDNNEFVEIEYCNGYKPRINVDGDSYAALAYDVFKYLRNH